jgi:pimeloyl-ACP methyl ester carboxylesterase
MYGIKKLYFMRILKRAFYYTGVFIVIAALLFVIVPYMLPVGRQQADAQLPFSNSRFSDMNGVLIHYRVFEPAGDTVKGNVVMVHGFCGSTFSWRNNAGTIAAAGYCVVCVDLPGFGYSSRKQGLTHSPEQSAMLVWRVLDSVCTGKWHIFGHSMGASVAASMAGMRPGRTESLWMFDGFSHNRMQKQNSSLLGVVVSSAPGKRWAEVLGANYFFKQHKFEEVLQSAYGQRPDTLAVEGYLKPLLLPGTASCIMDVGSTVGTGNQISLKQLPVPVFFVWGTNDTWLPLNKFKPAIDSLPGAKLLTVNGAGHCAMETHSQLVNGLVLAGLNSIH